MVSLPLEVKDPAPIQEDTQGGPCPHPQEDTTPTLREDGIPTPRGEPGKPYAHFVPEPPVFNSADWADLSALEAELEKLEIAERSEEES